MNITASVGNKVCIVNILALKSSNSQHKSDSCSVFFFFFRVVINADTEFVDSDCESNVSVCRITRRVVFGEQIV